MEVLLPGLALVCLGFSWPDLLGRQSEHPDVLGLFSLRYLVFLISFACLLTALLVVFVLAVIRLRGFDRGKLYPQPSWLLWIEVFIVLAGWVELAVMLDRGLLSVVPAALLHALGLAFWSLAILVKAGEQTQFRSEMKRVLEWIPSLDDRLNETILPRLVQKGFNRLDAAYIVVCLILAGIFILGYWRSADVFVFLGSDAANISGFVAGRSHPELFFKDEVLSDLQNFNIYSTVHIPLIQWLGKFFGDFGKPWVLLFPPHLVLQLLGFYWLGRLLTGNRFWAILLSLTSILTTTMNLGEWWGITYDAMPRVTFQVLLPYLLGLAVLWRGRPMRWVWLMALAGLLVYVHPVSTPGWGLAVWLGLIPWLPRGWSLPRKAGWLLICGLVFLLVVTPFAVHYLANYAHGATADYGQVTSIMAERLAPGFLDPAKGIREFFSLLSSEYWLLLVFAIAGAVAAIWRSRASGHKNLLLIALWSCGVLLTAIPLPLLDHALARLNGTLPLEIDLIRGLRYVFPLLLLTGFSGLALIPSRRDSPPYLQLLPLRLLAAGFAIFFSLVWWIRYPVTPIAHGIECLAHGEWTCPLNPEEQDLADVMQAIRMETPPGSAVLSSSYTLEIRYYALRSVVFSYKDGGILSYSNPEALKTWSETNARFEEANSLEDPLERLEGLTDMAQDLGADYLLADFPVHPDSLSGMPLDIRYSNTTFTLLEIQATTGEP